MGLLCLYNALCVSERCVLPVSQRAYPVWMPLGPRLSVLRLTRDGVRERGHQGSVLVCHCCNRNMPSEGECRPTVSDLMGTVCRALRVTLEYGCVYRPHQAGGRLHPLRSLLSHRHHLCKGWHGSVPDEPPYPGHSPMVIGCWTLSEIELTGRWVGVRVAVRVSR